MSLVPTVADALAISLRPSWEASQPPGKHGPTAKLLQQMERIQRLPKAKEGFVMQMIDAIPEQQGRQAH